MIRRVGEATIRGFRGMLYATGFFWEIVIASVLFLRRRHVATRVLIMQILFTGVEALWVIAIIAVSLGAIIIIEGISLLPQFGQGRLIYSILIAVITRELGPILTAFIIIARSGTAIATELGNTVISHEVEAYMSVGINPVSYLIVPRFLGVTISLVVLNLYFNLFGLLGSYLLTLLIRPIPFLEYFSNVLSTLRPDDVFSALVKSLIFGVIISTVATYFGFRVERSATEIPQMAIKAVGRSFVLCIVANAVVTMIYYI